VIITRSDELQEVFNKLGKGSSYGASTTHMGKLLPRIQGGGAGGWSQWGDEIGETKVQTETQTSNETLFS
jgi:hypothetical protein